MLPSTRYRELVAEHGLSLTHRQVIDWVPEGSRVLEIGCSSGYVGEVLLAKGCSVLGVEPDPLAATEARARGLEVLVGSIEDRAFREQIKGTFDVVIAADVLEHLREPEPVLAEVQRWLRDGGRAIVALPNLATWEVRWKLFARGEFEYTDSGMMDRTHVHFFTWDTFRALADAQGWRTEDVMFEGWNVPLVNELLVTRPRDFLARTENEPATAEGALGLRQAALRYGAKRLVSLGRRLGKPLQHAWPNLCAPHFAVLLSPPPSRAR